jgi:hypothetical protein
MTWKTRSVLEISRETAILAILDRIQVQPSTRTVAALDLRAPQLSPAQAA